MKRREFIKATGRAGVAGAALGLYPVFGVATGSLAGAPDMAAEALSKSWFEQYLNQNFWVSLRGLSGINLQLIELRDGPKTSGLEQFQAVFQAERSGRHLVSGIYTLLHPDGGTIKLHLESCRKAGLAYYQATFSLLKPV